MPYEMCDHRSSKGFGGSARFSRIRTRQTDNTDLIHVERRAHQHVQQIVTLWSVDSRGEFLRERHMN
ncbi:hypothetical protein [Ralstonia insidiosa]|uniref:hypothetical protein n=1 Tax=Ralstonia insidiosa TaxID=190721 RepID=UPI001427E4D8|nr:hypothetical protein [Ralstonia insidiosa]